MYEISDLLRSFLRSFQKSDLPLARHGFGHEENISLPVTPVITRFDEARTGKCLQELS